MCKMKITKPELTKNDVMKWLKKAKNTEVADKILSLVQDHNGMIDVTKYWKDSRDTIISLMNINLWLKTAFVISTLALVYTVGVIL